MNEIKEVIHAYFEAWNRGFENKNPDEIRSFMSKDFKGFWAHSRLDTPDQYNYDYDLHEVLKQYELAVKSFEPITITERNNGHEYIIQGKETNTINGEPYPAECMFIWRKEESEWKLLREYIELEV
ncbi:nuclear transport factor 2 family protein [Neobacillus mesonae]|nr:nuclear transport factor 2 family protein [Neobacillus mesonae]